MRSRSSPNDVILITATEGQKDKLHIVSLENADLGPILLHSQQYLPSSSLSPSSSHTHTLPPKPRCSWEACNTGFYVSPKGLVHTHGGFTQVLISTYPSMYLKPKAQPHKQITLSNKWPCTSYCAVPNVCIYYVIHEREMRVSFSLFHWASEDNMGWSEQLANV